MATSPKPMTPQFDEQLVNLFEEQYLPLADTIYRFGFALTLSLDGAHTCVRQAFQKVSGKLKELSKSLDANPKSVLIEACWQAYKDTKGGGASPIGQSAITSALKPLPIEGRAAVAAIDGAGLSPSEAARVLSWSEVELRQHLASARRTLLRDAVQL